MKNKLGISYDFKARVLTPVHIGCNDRYTPISHYILLDKSIRIIDSSKLGVLLYENNLIDHYNEMVIKTASKEKSALLSNFLIKYKLINEVDNLTVKTLKTYGIQNPIEINRFINEHDKPFIPGSSVKGAFIHALVYDFLINTSNGQSTLRRYLVDISSKKINSSSKKTKSLFEKVKDIELASFLEKDERYNSMDLHIRDEFISSSLGVYAIDRVNIVDEKESELTILKEYLNPEDEFKLRVNIKYINVPKKELNDMVLPLSSQVDFFGLLNQHSKDNLMYELSLLERSNSIKVLNYASHLEKILKLINESDDQKGYFRLGAGKMNFYQSLGMAAYKMFENDLDNDLWLNYLKYSFNVREIDSSWVLPTTRTMCTDKQYPTGWIEIA